MQGLVDSKALDAVYIALCYDTVPVQWVGLSRALSSTPAGSNGQNVVMTEDAQCSV